ncbi:pyridoxamine 5'-phosphate oxidase family protein [Halostella sp. JP-L12]|uniref:pyridoxamine 5'-phosphate oxidase family protein n=1 Tax=Halostella TaxID=1843185 RepID=UPI000EF7F671|nr:MULTISPECIES: pyridoxamine 5'-phosphate oxidase family protein [Halostella]NHN49198.1 pyridoxamine 5'-phosphate oxidase family protein [Halostella sp. JP-L12]
MTTDELGDYGMERMDDEEIGGFLSSQSVGVLCFSAEDAPDMRPMSYWYDGEDSVYFLYVVGSNSRKEALTRRADTVRFLVYRANSTFEWRSVLLTGTIEEVPESERDAVLDAAELKWRPELFERASASEDTKLYRLRIEKQDGIKHSELPPGFKEN